MNNDKIEKPSNMDLNILDNKIKDDQLKK